MKTFLPVFIQRRNDDCGSTCLRMIMEYYSTSISVERMESLFDFGAIGVSLAQIEKVARQIGFGTKSCCISIEELQNSKSFPCIVYCEPTHFMVLYSMGESIILADPRKGIIKLSYAEFESIWLRNKSGIVLFLKWITYLKITELNIMPNLNSILTRSEIEQIAKEFIQEVFPDCIAAAITGSALSANFTKKSDIDIIIISRLNLKVHVEKFYRNGLEIHSVILPESKLDKVLDDDYARREGIYIHMLSTCVIIKDPNGTISKMKDETLLLFEEGPPLMNSMEMIDFRNRIESLLDDIEGATEFEQIVFLVSKAIALTLELNLGYHRKFKSKNGPIVLKEIDAPLMSGIVSSLKIFYLNQVTTEFLTTIRCNLSLLGSSITKQGSGFILEQADENQFVIAISETENIIDCYKEVAYPVLRTKSVTECFLFRNSDASYPHVKFLLIIKDFRFAMNKPIYEAIGIVNTSHKLKIDFPFNYISQICGIRGIDSLIDDFSCKAFSEICKVMKGRNSWSQDEAIDLSFSFLLAYSLECKMDRKAVVRLCKYLYDWWQAKSENVFIYIGHQRLLNNRKMRRKKFEFAFEKLEDDLEVRYGDVFSLENSQAKNSCLNFWGSTMKSLDQLTNCRKNKKFQAIVPSQMNKYSPFRNELEDWLFHKHILDRIFDMLSVSSENKICIAYFATKVFATNENL